MIVSPSAVANSLLPLALRNYTVDLIEATVRARRAVFDNVAAHLACSTALARFGCSALHSFGRARALRLETCIGGGSFG